MGGGCCARRRLVRIVGGGKDKGVLGSGMIRGGSELGRQEELCVI